jgi:hypothetical protein
VQQREVAAVQIPAAALKLEMKTMHRKNRNLQQLHSISQIVPVMDGSGNPIK